MKCSVMLHFIWVFTVCQSSFLGDSSKQRVNIGMIGSISDTQGRETCDLLRHIFYSKGAAILEIIPVCGKFLCFFSP